VVGAEWLGERSPIENVKGADLEGFLILRRAKGSSLIQSRWVLMASLVWVVFKVQLVCSTLPEDCGW
jgi:hypothetical protein